MGEIAASTVVIFEARPRTGVIRLKVRIGNYQLEARFARFRIYPITLKESFLACLSDLSLEAFIGHISDILFGFF